MRRNQCIQLSYVRRLDQKEKIIRSLLKGEYYSTYTSIFINRFINQILINLTRHCKSKPSCIFTELCMVFGNMFMGFKKSTTKAQQAFAIILLFRNEF